MRSITRLARTTSALCAMLVLLAWPLHASALAQVGPPASAVQSDEAIRSITVSGNTRYTDRQLSDALGVFVGGTMDDEVVDEGMHVLFKTFRVRVSAVQVRPYKGGSEPGIDVRLDADVAVFLERYVSTHPLPSSSLCFAMLPTGRR